MTGFRRAAAASLSALIAAAPASAAAVAERVPVELPSVAKPVDAPQIPGLTILPSLQTVPDLAPAATPVLDAGPQLPPPSPAAAPEGGAEPANPSIKEAAEAGGQLANIEAPVEKAKILDALYDKSKAQGAPAQTLSSPPERIPAPLNNGRLPRDLVPQKYSVSLKIDPEAEGFSGRVTIAAKVLRPTKTIVLHSLGHEISEVIVNGRRVDPKTVRIDPVAETLSIPLDAALAKGKAVVEIAYSGRYNKQMRGLYESKAKFEGKEERYAFTHLEPTNARRVFPAFDEPDLKASFAVTVTAPERLTVLSNMPPASRTAEAGWQTVAFQETPKMSTYLFAVAAARLTPTSRVVQGTKITVWTMPQDAGQTAFALDAAENALKRLNAYFGIKYQLPKMDLVAVPDFAAGAMENWGAIFFRDSALLVDPKLSSTKARRRVAEVVTHEIVHQWFGNLVTMKWWNDLWLNEAFATWMAYKMIAPWRPGWNEWVEFEQRKREPLAIDALRATRAITSAASSTAEIQAMFDPLTYSKGGALLRMIEGYLGETKFRAGIRAYMKAHRYGNTAAKDLWRALEKASGQPVMKMAEDWLGKPGYPVLSVEAASEDGRTLKLSQRRFSASGSAGPQTDWTIPVVIDYRLQGEKKTRTYRAILDSGGKTITLPGRGRLAWAYPNDAETGFYRVRLDGRLSSALQASARQLGDLERMGLLNHLWAQTKSGDLPIGVFLDTLRAFKKDRSRVALEEAAGYLKTLAEDLADSDADRAAVARMAGDLLGAHWKRLGWVPKRGEGDEPALARAAVLSALGIAAPTGELASGVRARVERWLADPASVPPALVSPVLNLGARFEPARFDAYRERLAKAGTPEQRDALLRALAEFREPAAADRLLAMTLTDEIRGQDAWKPYVYLLSNPAAQARAWDFVKARWKELRDKLGPRGSERVIGAASGLRGAERLEDVRRFFGEPANRVDSAKRTLEQTLEAIELSARFKQAQGPALSAWLQRAYPPVK